MPKKKVAQDVSVLDVEKWNIHQRIHGIMGEFDYVQKLKSGMPYKSVSHDSVTRKLQPMLLKYRVICRPYVDLIQVNGNQTMAAMIVDFVNIDNPEDVFQVRTFGHGNDTQDKGPGKAMSYAFKYAVLKALCIETGDDPENDSIETSKSNGVTKNFTKSKVLPQDGLVEMIKLQLNKHNNSASYFKAFIQDKYGVGKLSEVPKKHYDDLMIWIKSEEGEPSVLDNI